MTNERDSARVAFESILLLMYAWNAAPVPGTDIPRSLLVTGRIFQFPIDFSAAKHLELTSSPDTVQSYAKDQAKLLQASRDIAKVLLEEHRAWHRELVNSRRPDPRVFSVGDIVFARRAVRSDASKERVGKLMYAMTGPWRIIEQLDGSSYRIEFCATPGRMDKKRAADLFPYPLELVPFEPVDGCDNQFSQIWRPIGKLPFAEAGLKGFLPSKPFKAPASFADVPLDGDFYWPSLAELNDEIQPFPWLPGEQDRLLNSPELDAEPIMYTGPPPEPPSVSPSLPVIDTLAASILRSTDRLFFINQRTSPSHGEWRLVRVVLDDSIALHPSCLQDGRFLVEFYVRHTADGRYNNANQRYWLQYHRPGDIANPLDTSLTHLIRPSETSETVAARKGLIVFRQWANLTHEATFLHGPFDFATVNGRKTRDRISNEDWETLAKLFKHYDNPPPTFDMPTYSVHVDVGVYSTFNCPALCTGLRAAAFLQQTTGDRLYPDKRS